MILYIILLSCNFYKFKLVYAPYIFYINSIPFKKKIVIYFRKGRKPIKWKQSGKFYGA